MNKVLGILVIVIIVLIGLAAIVYTSPSIFKDVGITNVTSSAAGIQGQKINISSTVKNYGILGTGNFVLSYYLTPTKSYNNKTFIGKKSISVGGLSSLPIDSEITLPTNITPGSYYILVYADTVNTLKESNRKNNGNFSKNTIVIS